MNASICLFIDGVRSTMGKAGAQSTRTNGPSALRAMGGRNGAINGTSTLIQTVMA